MYVNPITQGVPRLTRPVLADWMLRAQEQPSPDPQRCEVLWCEFLVEAARTRIHDPDLQARDAIRVLAYEGRQHVARVPLERDNEGVWVSTPTRAMRGMLMYSPLILRAHIYGNLTLEIEADWSLWTRPEAPDRAALVEAAGRLLRNGWQVRDADETAFPELAAQRQERAAG